MFDVFNYRCGVGVFFYYLNILIDILQHIQKDLYMSDNDLNVITPNGRILVKEIEVENKSAGGIILTETSDPDNKARLGEIVYNGIAVNNLHKNRDYSKGNKVYFGKYAGATLVVDGVKYISMLESEIVGISK